MHCDDPTLHEACAADGRVLVTSKRGPYPHTDGGVEVRRVFHEMGSRALEDFNSQFNAIFG